MGRTIDASGKPPADVLEECIRRFNERSLDGWDHSLLPPPQPREITRSRVNRSGDSWDWLTLDEFIREYNQSDCATASFECSNNTHLWRLSFEYDSLGPSAYVSISGPERPDLAFIGQPFDDWRIEAEKKFAAERERLLQAIPTAREPNIAKRLWRWFRQSTDHELIGGLALFAIVALLGLLVRLVTGWL
jgi:hypothetical protein